MKKKHALWIVPLLLLILGFVWVAQSTAAQQESARSYASTFLSRLKENPGPELFEASMADGVDLERSANVHKEIEAMFGPFISAGDVGYEYIYRPLFGSKQATYTAVYPNAEFEKLVVRLTLVLIHEDDGWAVRSFNVTKK